MSKVQEQYEAYPYPQRNPADERKRLIVGSPSHPLEIEHFLFGGKRDWQQPFRALVAGGGTGDGLIQLAALLHSAGRSAEITYLDLSKAARKVAEARAAVRGLTNISFHTASLFDAADYGRFDYIDCCGVLHHLTDPQAGFTALAGALSAEGGMGLMVYAPHGRAGVYPLQRAFGALWPDAPPKKRLAQARKLMARLPAAHPFRSNPHLVDHQQSDAGFYDLLMHSQDRPFTITELCTHLQEAGLGLVAPTQPALYDPYRISPDLPRGLPTLQAMQIAEDLRGTLKTHVVYATHSDRASTAMARPDNMALVPHLKGVNAGQLARYVAKNGVVPVSHDGGKEQQPPAPETAPVVALVDGTRSLARIAAQSGHDPIAFRAVWAQVHGALAGWGLLLYGT